jgi:hypothetical protein
MVICSKEKELKLNRYSSNILRIRYFKKMKIIFQHIKGDKTIWAIFAVLAVFSFMPVYSASTNLVYVVGSGSTLGHL